MQKQKVDQMSFQNAPMLMALGRCRTQLTIFQVIGHVVIWLIIATFTLGIGALFWPYAAAKFILEAIVMTDEAGNPSARLRCNMGLSEQIGHIIMWLILMVLTGGLAGLCYLFGVAQMAINRTELVSI